ncbi:MAG: MlaD family protein [Solirubrobacteraceae bacterium]|nr:MlaD family protein [Solirubrobacteraceae bacterium]
MLTSTPGWRFLVIPIVFVLTTVLLSLGLWRAFGGTMPFAAQGYLVHVTVPSADALFHNTDVRMAGVKIGRIRDVERDGRRVDLTLEIDAEYVPLRREVRATVRSKSLLGEGYLELAPGSPKAAIIPDGGRIDAKQVRRTERLDDVLQAFDPETRAQLRKMATGVSRAFGGRSGDLNDALGHAPSAVRSTGELLDVLRDQADPTRRLISSADAVFTAAAERVAPLRAAIREGDRLFTATAARDRDLQRTIEALPSFLDHLRRASVQLGAASPDLQRAVTALEPTVARLEPAVRSMQTELPAFRTAFDRLTPTMRSITTAAPALERILDATTASAAPIYESLRELIPFLKLASASKDSFVANFGIVSSLVNGVAVSDITGKRSHTASGVLSLWNEIVGGYTKKLPTNTANPYPKPGSTDDIATNGVLSAYDCRNKDNPLIVPPFGGAPPCRTQGPWTFDGKTAYYPRLQKDGP